MTTAQLGDPTPCGDWDTRALLNHLIEINLQYAAITDGREPVANGVDRVGADHVAAYSAAARAAQEAFARPGMLEQMYDFPWGQDPGWTIVRHVCNELLIHTWDLSRATGQSTDLVPDYVPESLATWRAWFDGFGGGERPVGGAFAPEQTAPDGSTDADRLAAYLGRSV